MIRALLPRWAGLTVAGLAAVTLPAAEVESGRSDLRQELRELRPRILQGLERDAPELRGLLEPPPAPSALAGYGELPEIEPSGPLPPTPADAEPLAGIFSWPRTWQLLTAARTAARTLQERVGTALADRSAAASTWRPLVEAYRSATRQLALVDAQSGYLRFWSAAIEAERARFDQETHLVELTRVRHRVRRALRGGDGATLQRLAGELLAPEARGADDPAPRTRLEGLERRVALEIAAAQEMGAPAPGLAVVELGATTALRLELLTDIDDGDFLRQLKEAVEGVWQADADGRHYRLVLSLRPLAVTELYRDATPPRRGATIDLEEHLRRFPAGRPVLTTGATSTHAFIGRHILLGADRIGARPLAHEVGHLLGFRDGYFRGYRDLGEEGYEIFEAVPDREDLMCAPGSGRVDVSHFERVIARIAGRPTR